MLARKQRLEIYAALSAVAVLAWIALYMRGQFATALAVPAFIEPTLVTVVVWAVLTLQFTGLGLLMLRLFAARRSAETLFLAFWLGLACTLAWLQVWSLWRPMSWQALLAPLALGLFGWLAVDREIIAALHRATRLRAPLLGASALVLWCAIAAQAPLREYDAGLYHLAVLRWDMTYPVVPGLGNLNPAFGLGSSLFLYLASLSLPGVPVWHTGVGLLLTVALLQLCISALRKPATLSSRLSALMIMPTLAFIGFARFSTTMYDVGSFVLIVAMALHVLQLLDRPSIPFQEIRETLYVVGTLGFAAVSVKIANAAFAGACIALVLVLLIRRQPVVLSRATVGVVTGLGGLAIVQLAPWLVRNVLLTGYPLYPLPFASLPFDWRMPATTVQTYRNLLSDFARVHGPGFEGASSNFSWLGAWITNSWRDGIVPIAIGVLVPLVMVLFARDTARRIGARWLILIPLWVGVVAWFFSAPETRYASALLWLAAAIPVAFCVTSTPRLVSLAIGLAFVAAVEMPNASYVLIPAEVPPVLMSGQVADEPDVPSVALQTWSTNSGLQVYGPPDGTDQIWDAPLPASAWQPDPNLRLRCADSLACGFTVQ